MTFAVGEWTDASLLVWSTGRTERIGDHHVTNDDTRPSTCLVTAAIATLTGTR